MWKGNRFGFLVACRGGCFGLGIRSRPLDLKMDGRDSSPPAGEDDRVAPVTDGLAKEAEALFSSRRFAECVDVLNQLLTKKEGDPKVSFLICH